MDPIHPRQTSLRTLNHILLTGITILPLQKHLTLISDRADHRRIRNLHRIKIINDGSIRQLHLILVYFDMKIDY
jgi:hypothetical protein